jgi:hypothetical protein
MENVLPPRESEEVYLPNADELRAEYTKFLNSIDNSVAKIGEYGELKEYIACSSETNAGDFVTESGTSNNSQYERECLFWEHALATAEMILDDWQSYYPELIK